MVPNNRLLRNINCMHLKRRTIGCELPSWHSTIRRLHVFTAHVRLPAWYKQSAQDPINHTIYDQKVLDLFFSALLMFARLLLFFNAGIRSTEKKKHAQDPPFPIYAHTYEET